MAANERGRSTVNVKRLVMWKQLTDDDSATTYAESAYAFTKSTMSAKYTPKSETADQYGDGIKVEDYVAKDGGSLEITLTGFKAGDGEYLFGETKTTDGVEVSGSDDVVPYQCVAYCTERPDGKLNLYKFPKVKWMPQGENASQKEGTKISYGSADIKGTYSPLLSTHKDSYKKYGVDPGTESAFIESWFTQADFYTSDAK